MNRVILIALAMVCVLLTTDTATAAIYAKEAIDPVVFDGEPEYPNGANPIETESAAVFKGSPRQWTATVSTAPEEQQTAARTRASLWWAVFWRWAWALL